MFVIRRDQEHVLGQGLRAQFEARMVAYIAAEYPERYAREGQAETLRFVIRGIDTAERNGILGEGAVAVLIELMYEFGEKFELSPDKGWVQKLLVHPTLPELAKVTAMRERVQARTQGRRIVRAQ